ALRLRLAGQRARAGERDRARGGAGRRSDRAGRFVAAHRKIGWERVAGRRWRRGCVAAEAGRAARAGADLRRAHPDPGQSDRGGAAARALAVWSAKEAATLPDPLAMKLANPPTQLPDRRPTCENDVMPAGPCLAGDSLWMRAAGKLALALAVVAAMLLA